MGPKFSAKAGLIGNRNDLIEIRIRHEEARKGARLARIRTSQLRRRWNSIALSIIRKGRDVRRDFVS